jgi:redox-sensitive bicupin YhaK (pirin superfamily)
MASPIEILISPRPHDLGGFSVRRILPYARRRQVGPFVFFDHMGPVEFAPGQGIDVRPHPHIGLATVTYLFEGSMIHRDSLGVVQPIEPGAVNWMTAGRGIVHSERSSADARRQGARVHGIQSWVALPREMEETAPAFQHHPADTLPRFSEAGVHMVLIAGSAYGHLSPVSVASPTFYLEVRMEPGAVLAITDEHPERAVYVAEGSAELEGESLEAGQMAVLAAGRRPRLQSRDASRVMLLGGAPLDGPRLIWWNFVSSSQARIDQARRDWKARKFAAVPGETEFIPLPES